MKTKKQEVTDMLSAISVALMAKGYACYFDEYTSTDKRTYFIGDAPDLPEEYSALSGTHSYPSEAEAWAHAPEPEPSVWLAAMDEMTKKNRGFAIMQLAKLWLDVLGAGFEPSEALMRAVLAAYVFVKEEKE